MFEWYGIDENVMPTWQDTVDAFSVSTSFANLQEALSIIDEAGKLLFDNYRPDEDLAKIKTVVILCWYGLTADQMIAIRKENFLQEKQAICIDNDIIIFDKSDYNILLAQLRSDTYVLLGKTAQRTHRKKYSQTTDYLLKSSSEQGVPLSSKAHLYTYLSRVSNVTLPLVTSKRFDFDELQKNGAYYRIYTDKSEQPLIEKIIKHKKCTMRTAFYVKHTYEAWLKNVGLK